MHDSADDLLLRGQAGGTLDLRHLSAFQQVYLTRDYTTAGHDLNTNRKGIVRMLERLEQTFQSRLFTPQGRSSLSPSPFADRLFNDLRFLNSAREALHDQVAEIRTSGRMLKVGTSPAIFRSEIFRTLFRALQTTERIRTSYVPVKSGDAAKALASGVCDLHVGCELGNNARFSSESIGDIPFQVLTKSGGAPLRDDPAFLVALDGRTPENGTVPGAAKPLEESRFIHWLDHPEDCPEGVRIIAPEIPRDPVHWTAEEILLDIRQPLNIHFLRQHPYEFLPSLVKGLKFRMNRK